MSALLRIRRLTARLKGDPVGAVLLSLMGDSTVYLIGGAVIGLGNIILVPLYTRTLEPREFGVYALVDVSILLIVTVAALKLDVSYLKWFAELDPRCRPQLLGTTLSVGLGASTLGGLALWWVVASHLGESWLHFRATAFAWMVFPIVVLENVQALLLTDLRARRCSVSYSSTAIIRLAVILAASYYLLVVRGEGLAGLFLGRLAGDAAAVVFLGVIEFRFIALRFSSSLLMPMLRFGAPLIWSIVVITLQDASGRYFLTHYASLEQVGLLGAAIKIGGVFQMLVSTPFGVAWGGMLFQIAKEREGQFIYSKILSYVYIVALGMALVLTIFAPTLFHIFTAPAYYPAITVLPFILLVRAVNVMEQPASAGVYVSGRTDLLALSYTAGLGVNLLALWLLVPRFGLMGTTWAWLLGSAVVPCLFLIFGQRRYRLSLRLDLLLVPIALWAAVFIIKAVTDSFSTAHEILFQSGLSFVVLVLIAVLMIHDLRTLRNERRSSAAVLEVSSQ